MILEKRKILLKGLQLRHDFRGGNKNDPVQEEKAIGRKGDFVKTFLAQDQAE